MKNKNNSYCIDHTAPCWPHELHILFGYNFTITCGSYKYENVLLYLYSIMNTLCIRICCIHLQSYLGTINMTIYCFTITYGSYKYENILFWYIFTASGYIIIL